MHSALLQLVTFLLRPTSTYRAIELDVPTAGLGVLSACFALVPLVLVVPSGRAVDRYGERRVLLLGALLTACTATGYVTGATSAAALAVAAAVHGTGHLLCVLAQQAAVARAAGPGRLDSAFGHYTLAASLGQALGPGLLGLADGASTIPRTGLLFAAAAGLAVLLIGCSLLAAAPAGQRTAGTSAAVAGPRTTGVRGLLRLPGLLPAVAVSGMVLAAIDVTLVFLPALGAERDLPAGFVGALLAVRAVASMASRVALGRMVALRGRCWLLAASTSLAAVATAAAAIPSPPWVLAVCVAALGVGSGVAQPLTMSWTVELAPAPSRGRALSLRLAGVLVGQALVPGAFGAMAAVTGTAGVFVATAASLAAATTAVHRSAADGSATDR